MKRHVLARVLAAIAGIGVLLAAGAQVLREDVAPGAGTAVISKAQTPRDTQARELDLAILALACVAAIAFIQRRRH